MSAFMVNNRTLTKIAKYMEACANYKAGEMRGLDGIEIRGDFEHVLREEGLVDKTGMFSASLIHRYLYDKNKAALVARYGEDVDMAREFIPMEDGGTGIDVSQKTRKEWLANLYTVSRCYLYQIEEGDFQNDSFFWLFKEWIGDMAAVLAKYVVEEVRPYTPGHQYKTWDEF